jgi:hypothetical protein
MTPNILKETQSLETLFAGIERAREGLLEGLKSTQLESGGWPTIYPDDKRSHHWTAAQNLHAILSVGDFPIYFDRAVAYLLRSRTKGGWQREKGIPYFHIYCSSDAITALTLLKQLNPIKKAVALLLQARNPDGGWGVVKGDTKSKVRPTCFALLAILHVDRAREFGERIDAQFIRDSLKYLVQAAADDGGWGFATNDRKSNISATAWTIYCLSKWREAGIEVDCDFHNAINILKANQHNGLWYGTSETFDIYIDGTFAFPHRAAGLGTSIVLLSLAEAAKQGIVSFADESLVLGLHAFLNHCVQYPDAKGLWVIPSSLGEGRPTLWDSAYGVMALQELGSYLLRHLAPAALRNIEILYRNGAIELEKRMQLLQSQLSFYEKLLADINSSAPDVLEGYLKRMLEVPMMRAVIIALILFLMPSQKGTLADVQTILNNMRNSNFRKSWILQYALEDVSAFQDQSQIKGILEKLSAIGLIRIESTQYELTARSETEIIDAIIKVPGLSGLLQGAVKAIMPEIHPLAKTLSIEKKTIIENCKARIRSDEFKIKGARLIGEHSFDIVAEKTYLLRSVVGVARIYDHEFGVTEAQSLVEIIQDSQKRAKITKVYIFAPSFNNEAELLLAQLGKDLCIRIRLGER